MLFLFAIAYLAGSIPFGKLYSRLGGVDIQTRGSGNIGYANVQRIMGWKFGVPTLVSDCAKGALPTCAAVMMFDANVGFWVGMTAVMGHVFPVWLRFRGGKGIATGLGMVIVLAPYAAVAGVAAYAVGLRLRATSAAASLFGIGVVIAGVLWQHPQWWWMTVIIACAALFTLRHNLIGAVPDHG